MSGAIYARAAVGYDELFARANLFRAAHLATGQKVLDVATGTGIVAQAAAEIVGSSGRVTASPHLCSKPPGAS